MLPALLLQLLLLPPAVRSPLLPPQVLLPRQPMPPEVCCSAGHLPMLEAARGSTLQGRVVEQLRLVKQEDGAGQDADWERVHFHTETLRIAQIVW